MSDLTKFINEKIESNRTHLDFECTNHVERNINLSVPWFLMAAYAYYEEDNPILTDARFDKLAKMMYNNWDDIEHHHKEYIDKDALRAGSYVGKYPERTKGGLKYLRSIYEEQKPRVRNTRSTRRGRNFRKR